MPKPIVAGLIAALSLPALAAPPPPAMPNPFNDRLRALGQADRDGALRRAVTLEGQRCGRLSDSVYRGPFGNLAFWQARCTPGGDYAIFLGPDGSAQVRPCADLPGLKLPVCRATAAADPKRKPATRR